MQSHYEINVSRNGQHLFATHPRSAVSECEAAALYGVLKLAFPARKGYELSVSFYDVTGYGMTELMARCPDCNKFVGVEQGEPELDPLDVELETTGSGEDQQPGAASVSGSVRLVLTCADCGTELMETNATVEGMVALIHGAADEVGHELEIENESAEATDRYDGKPGTPSRYRRHYYGASVTGTIVCSCGARAEFDIIAEEQASGFDSLN